MKVTVADDQRVIFGQYLLGLTGEVVTSAPMRELAKKTLRVTFYARGTAQDSRVALRLYQYTQADCKLIDYIADVVDTPLDGEWREYSGVVSMTPWHAASFAKVGIVAEAAEIDQLTVAVVDPKVTSAQKSFHGRWHIPVNRTPVVVDGKLGREEWQAAVIIQGGFMDIMQQALVERQTDIRLTADTAHLYLAAIFDRRAGGFLNTVRGRDGNVWEDESLELFINPSFSRQDSPNVVYQIIINTAGVIFDQAIRKSTGQNEVEWECAGFQWARSYDDGRLVMEVAIPLASVGLRPDEAFGLNVCRNLKLPVDFASVTGLGYTDFSNMVTCLLTEQAPAVTLACSPQAESSGIDCRVGIRNVTTGAQRFKVDVQRRGAAESAISEPVSLTPQQERQLLLPRHPRAERQLDVSLHIIDDAAATVFQHAVHYNADNIGQAARIDTTAKFRSQIEYYPAQHKVNVRLFGMQARQEAMEGASYSHAQLRIAHDAQAERGPALFDGRIDQIRVEDDTGHVTLPFTPPGKGTYRVEVALYGQDGTVQDEASGSFQVIDMPWLGNAVGKERTVIPPFAPITSKGDQMTCWGRTYQVSGSGLPRRIVSAGQEVLAEPIHWVADDGHGAKPGRDSALRVTERSEDCVRFSGSTRFDTLVVNADAVFEYDGMLLYDVVVQPVGKTPATLTALTLRIPLKEIRYFHTAGDHMAPTLYMMEKPQEGYVDLKVSDWTPASTYRNRYPTSYYFPPGDGLVWSSIKVQSPRVIGNFLPSIWLGNATYGINWFADSDQGWSHDAQTPCYTITRQDEVMVLNIHVIAKPTSLTEPRHLRFGLLATPVRPRVTGANVRFSMGIMGFGNPFETGSQSLECRDFVFAADYFRAYKTQGKFTQLYMAGNLHNLAESVAPAMKHEWGDAPMSYYTEGRSIMPYKIYGSDINRYTSFACSLLPSRVDYAVHQIAQWIEHAYLGGVYIDNSYPNIDRNIQHAPGAYQREDGAIQGVYRSLQMRELLKRIAVIADKHGSVRPYISIHKTSTMQPAAFSFADLLIDGEHDTRETQYNHMEYYPLVAQEVIGAGSWGANNGWLPMIKSPELLKGTAATRNALACLKLFDPWIWPAHLNTAVLESFRRIEVAFGIDADDCRFYGYWTDEARGLLAVPDSCKASYYVRPWGGILVYLTNFTKQEQRVTPTFATARWLEEPWQLVDAETGTVLDRQQPLTVGAQDFRCLWLKR